MSKSIEELVAFIGSENIKVQFLNGAIVSARMRGKYTALTFETPHVSVIDLMNPNCETLACVLFMPHERVKEFAAVSESALTDSEFHCTSCGHVWYGKPPQQCPKCNPLTSAKDKPFLYMHCPFCGSTDKIPAMTDGESVTAQCAQCGATGPRKTTAQEANTAWRTAYFRHQTLRLLEEIDKLNQAWVEEHR